MFRVEGFGVWGLGIWVLRFSLGFGAIGVWGFYVQLPHSTL